MRYAMTLISMVCSIGNAYGQIEITGFEIHIDKPTYNSHYSCGVEVHLTSSAAVVSVYVEHLTESEASVGSWYLDEISPGRWWAHSPNHVSYSQGVIVGDFRVTVTDENDDVLVCEDIAVPEGVDLDLVSDLEMHINDIGYRFTMSEIEGADVYYWRLREEGEVIDGSWVDSPNDFPMIPFDMLILGSDCRFYGFAYNHFSCGPYDVDDSSYFRSYDRIEFIAIEEPTPTQETNWGSIKSLYQ